MASQPEERPTSRLDGLTQRQVAKVMGVSQARILALEKRAIKNLRKAIEEEAAKQGLTPLEWIRGEE